MKLLTLGSQGAVIAILCLVGSAGVASVAPRTYYALSHHGDTLQDHQSSLHARIMMADGTARTITLVGVGCTESICSRVAVRCMKADSVWLDGLASVRDISPDRNDSVKAVFSFRDGSKRTASIVYDNRVLYIDGRFGRTERLDIASLAKIDFLN
jgi:hypothetical protein